MHASKDQFAQIFKTPPDALIIVDHNATIQYATATVEVCIGMTKDELHGNTIWQFFQEQTNVALYDAIAQVMRTRAPLQTDYYSPLTNCWLAVDLSPVGEDTLLSFHEKTEYPWLQNTLYQNALILQNITDSLYLCIGLLTPDGILLDINNVPLEYGGIRREEVVGKPFDTFPSWSTSPVAQHQLREAIKNARRGETVRFEARVWPGEAVYLDLEVAIIPYIPTGCDIEYLIYTSTIINVRRQAEEELINAIPQFVWMAHPDGAVYYVNQRWMDYNNVSEEHIQGKNWIHDIHPDDRQQTLTGWHHSLKDGSPYEIEYRVRNGKTGEYRWFLAQGVPLKNAQGQIIRWLGTLTDIHEKKQAEEEIRLLINTIPQFVWMARLDGYIYYVNQRWLDYTGATEEQLLGENWLQFVHPDDRQNLTTIWHNALRTGTPGEVEHRTRQGKTGEYRWFLARAVPLKNTQGQIIKWFGTVTDIHAQKQAEESLRISEARFKVLFESDLIGMVIANMQGKITEANDTYAQIVGYTREELLSGELSIEAITAPEFRALHWQVINELRATGTSRVYEKEYERKDGRRTSAIIGSAQLDESNNTYISFVLDITERKELEKRKDEFVSIASHELKTPLTALRLLLSHLQRGLKRAERAEAERDLVRMEAQVITLTRLINDLLDVSKIQMGKFDFVDEPFDLDAMLHDVVDRLQQTTTTHTLRFESSYHGPILADHSRLEQVITNLISNAIKYSPQAETVDIFLSRSNNHVLLKVQDYGVGISREHQRAIFERFNRGAYSAREKAFPGLGMGLYIAHEIVKQYGGDIVVESREGKGSTFIVSLPLQPQKEI
ncbi:MAG TPA: PAS domain S-box protein [Ktedonobacteraceae bacterium]|jgi:PAS domain S-box-containing protein|nr:PAS domain S-box protein [Ktedonobacteraceae bacterium]